MDIPQQHRVPLATALRATAERLANGARYEWGHVGRCNCGHLVQSLTGHSDREILRAFRHDLDEWTELANDYCPVTGDDGTAMFRALYALGLTARDVHHLEYLSDPRVLATLPEAVRRRGLARNQREDVVCYLRAMANCLVPDSNSVRGNPDRPERRLPPRRRPLEQAPASRAPASRPGQRLPRVADDARVADDVRTRLELPVG